MAITEDANISVLARPPVRGKTYEGAVTATEGQEFKIETSPAGSELLALTVPAGKVWSVLVRIDVLESDA